MERARMAVMAALALLLAAGDVARQLARRVTVDDLAKAGRGLLAEVEDDDGSQVLVWLR
jgi:hypothetical protein